MATLSVLTFDHGGCLIQFDTWLDDLQLYLLSDSRDSVSLFDHTSGASLAPPDTPDSATRSQWLTRDAAARLAVRNHLPLAERAHFGQHKTAQALYDAVVARYSSPATASLSRFILPYLFPEMSTFATVEDLITHLHTSDTRYRADLQAEFLDKNPPPMYITLYFIVNRLPESLHAVGDHFLALDPTDLTVDLLEKHLLAFETSIVAVGSARGTPRTPFFEGCSPSPLAPSYASAAAAAAAATAADILGKSGGGGSGGGGGGGSGGGGGGGGGGGSGGGSGGFGGGGGGSSGSGGGGGGGHGSGGGGTGGGRGGAVQRGGSGGGHRQHQQRPSETPMPQPLPKRYGVDIFALDYNAILATMNALTLSAEGDCYLCVPPDQGIEAAALGASESALLATAHAEALHTFTLDSGEYRCPPGCEVSTTTTGCQRVAICTCTRTGRHLATFSRRPGSSLYTLTTEPPQVAASDQVSAAGPVAAPCSCCLLSHQTLHWHHRLGHPSLPRLRGMHSRLLVSSLPRSLPPLLPSPAPPCLPCVEGQQRAAPHSSSFPLTSAPLQTLQMDVPSPAPRAGPAPSGVSQVDPLLLAEPVEPGGANPEGAETGGAETEGAEPRGAESEGAESGGAEPRGTASAGDPDAGGTGAGGAGVTTGAGGTGGAGAAGPGGARTSGTGAAGAGCVGGAGAGDLGAGGTGAGGVGAGDLGAGGPGAGGTGAGDPGDGGTGSGDPRGRGAGAGGAGDEGAGTRGAGDGGTGAGGAGAGGTGARGARAGGAGVGGTGAGGAGAGDLGAGGASAGRAGAGGTGAGGTVHWRPFFVPPPPLSLSPPGSILRQTHPQLQPDSPLSAPSPYVKETDTLTVRREPASSLADGPDPESDLVRAASPNITRLLATILTDP
ncbi:unnamed protein product [Closterium sp. NIES-54]